MGALAGQAEPSVHSQKKGFFYLWMQREGFQGIFMPAFAFYRWTILGVLLGCSAIEQVMYIQE